MKPDNKYIKQSIERLDILVSKIEILDNPIKAKGHLGIWDFS